MKYWLAAFMMTIPLMSFAAWQGNTPCSGKKGGVDYCQGEQFVCMDGTESASKRKCDPKIHGTEPKDKKPRGLPAPLRANEVMLIGIGSPRGEG